SLYNHIKSKQEILALIIIAISEEYTNTINLIVTSEASTIEMLDRVIKLHIDITERNPDALASLNNDWMHLPTAELREFLSMRDEYEERFRQIIKNGISKGEIKNVESEVIIFSMLSTLRTLYLWYGKKKNFNAKTLRRDLRDILLKGIA